MERISKALLSCLLMVVCLGISAQNTGEVLPDSTVNEQLAEGEPADTAAALKTDENGPKKYVAIEAEQKKLLPFMGFTVSVDLLGPGMYLLSGEKGNFEAALRLNLYNTYFPIFEAGYGICNSTDFNTKIRFETKAPFARIGFDMNMLKNKFQDNRLYVGLRYGISRFNYDISGNNIKDPIWENEEEFNKTGIGCTSHWAEVVFGIQAKLVSIVHLGWSIRYKFKIHDSNTTYVNPPFVPGYGSTTFGGSFNLIFDLNWGKGKTEKKTLLKAEIKD